MSAARLPGLRQFVGGLGEVAQMMLDVTEVSQTSHSKWHPPSLAEKAERLFVMAEGVGVAALSLG